MKLLFLILIIIFSWAVGLYLFCDFMAERDKWRLDQAKKETIQHKLNKYTR